MQATNRVFILAYPAYIQRSPLCFLAKQPFVAIYASPVLMDLLHTISNFFRPLQRPPPALGTLLTTWIETCRLWESLRSLVVAFLPLPLLPLPLLTLMAVIVVTSPGFNSLYSSSLMSTSLSKNLTCRHHYSSVRHVREFRYRFPI